MNLINYNKSAIDVRTDIVKGTIQILGGNINPTEFCAVMGQTPEDMYVNHFKALADVMKRRSRKSVVNNIMTFSEYIKNTYPLDQAAWLPHYQNSMPMHDEETLEAGLSGVSKPKKQYVAAPIWSSRVRDLTGFLTYLREKKNFSIKTIAGIFDLIGIYFQEMGKYMDVPEILTISIKKIQRKVNGNRAEDTRVYIDRDMHRSLVKGAMTYAFENGLYSKEKCALEAMRNELALTILDTLGLRLQELVNIKVTDYIKRPKLDDGSYGVAQLRVVRLKSNKEQFLPLTDSLAKKFNRYIRTARKMSKVRLTGIWLSTKLLVPIEGKTWVNDMMNNVFDRHGVDVDKRFTPHDYRATIITDLYKLGKDPEVIASWISHKSGIESMYYVIRYEVERAAYSNDHKDEGVSVEMYANLPARGNKNKGWLDN